jgi:23S rRNA (uracil1939-C5)-methyltransferase
VEPICPVARSCGGCQIQEMNYESQLAFKKNKVDNNLIRIGKLKDYEIFDTIGMENPLRYRNKAQFPIGKNRDGEIIYGFYAGRTHSIIENKDCIIGIEENQEILEIILDHMNKYGIEPYDENTNKGILRHVLIRKGFVTGEIMVSLIINAKSFKKIQELSKELLKVKGMTDISLNINMEKTNVILGKEIISIHGDGYISDYIGDIKFRISPLSFFQVNPVQTKVLYSKALEYANLTGGETVLDLYCGVGTISLFLANNAKKVIGVEIVEQAITDAKINAKINNIENVDFYTGKAEEVIPALYKNEGIKADVVVVDPPRKGCDKTLLETIIQIAPDRIVYVSCDSATLARDLNFLSENGYKVEKVQPVDLFPNSVHVETVVLLSQQKPNDRIEVELDLDELDVTSAEMKATYAEIKEYVLKEHGMKVSSLYISQVKRKCGLEVGENYNLAKSEDARQPQCPEEKEKAIVEALRHFGMII